MAFFLSSFLTSAQTTVVGRVVVYNGEPVCGVNIWCPEQERGTSSDSTGYFELTCDIPCTLEFSHLLYKKECCRITATESPFVVVLRNKFNNLKEVVVAGKTTPGRVYSSKKWIEMIPAILGEQDILKYLATTPGVVTTNALDPGIYVRGSNSCENGFLTHNMEIANPDHLTGILSTFDPYLLNNSVIYKSGYPANYNSYLSSYIQMQPDPGNKKEYEGELTLGLVSSALKAQGPILKNHTSFAASIRTSYLQTIAKLYNKSIKGEENQNYMPEYGFNDVTVSLDSRLSNRWKVSAFGLFTMDQLTMKLNENVQYDFDWHTCSANAGVWYTPANGDVLHFRVGIKSAFSKGDAGGSIPMGGGNRNYSAIARIMYGHIFSDKWQLNIGGKFEQARFETANKPDVQDDILVRSSDKNFNIYELYGDLTYRINDFFTLYGGLNYQYYRGDSHVSCFSPRAKFSFSQGGLTLWADYAQTAQYLSLYPYFTVKTPVDIWYPLEKGMKPARCHQFSIGAEQDIGDKINLYAGIFYKKMVDVKDFSSGISTQYTALADNMIEGSGYAKGVEFNLALSLGRFSSRANYTLSESKRKFAEINQGKSFFPPYDVKHNVVINGSYDFSTRFTLNALWTLSSGVYTTFPVGVVVAHNITGSENNPVLIPVYTDRYNYKLPNNHRLDVNLDYLIPYKCCKLKLSIGAYNAYNHSNPSFVYFKPEESDGEHTKFIPKSKVMLPFIPYISLRIRW
ncbi:MAG: TonB-dependent receptor [Odoribacter sp.]